MNSHQPSMLGLPATGVMVALGQVDWQMERAVGSSSWLICIGGVLFKNATFQIYLAFGCLFSAYHPPIARRVGGNEQLAQSHSRLRLKSLELATFLNEPTQ